MIETRIPGIDTKEIELSIEKELKKVSLEIVPGRTGELEFYAEETVFRKQLYGLSYYLKKLNNPVYTRNAMREFLTSGEYRRTFWFLLKRALGNKIRLLFKGIKSW